MLSLILDSLGFSSTPQHTNPTGPFTYSEAVFPATHNSYSGDLDTETAAGVFTPFTTSGERYTHALWANHLPRLPNPRIPKPTLHGLGLPNPYRIRNPAVTLPSPVPTHTHSHRGGILEQLDAGLRFVELDVFNENLDNFTIGHGFPCDSAPFSPFKNSCTHVAGVQVRPCRVRLRRRRPHSHVPRGRLPLRASYESELAATGRVPAAM